MIAIFTNDAELAERLKVVLLASDVESLHFPAGEPESIGELYSAVYRAVVADSHHPLISQMVWLEMLRNLAKRLPVFILQTGNNLSNSTEAFAAPLI